MNCSCRPAVADFQFFKLIVNMNLIKIRKFFKFHKSSFIFQNKQTGNYGLRYVNRKNFRFTEWKLEILRFTLGKSENGKNFRFTEWKLEILRFTSRKTEKFPVYGMETGNFTVYGMETGNFTVNVT